MNVNLWDAEGKYYVAAAKLAVSPDNELVLWLMADGMTTAESDVYWRVTQIGGARMKWKLLGWL